LKESGEGNETPPTCLKPDMDGFQSLQARQNIFR